MRCVYPSCTRCSRCEASARAVEMQQTELDGLRATVRAIEAVAVLEADALVARMARNGLEGRYPDSRRVA